MDGLCLREEINEINALVVIIHLELQKFERFGLELANSFDCFFQISLREVLKKSKCVVLDDARL